MNELQRLEKELKAIEQNRYERNINKWPFWLFVLYFVLVVFVVFLTAVIISCVM